MQGSLVIDVLKMRSQTGQIDCSALSVDRAAADLVPAQRHSCSCCLTLIDGVVSVSSFARFCIRR